MFNSVRIFKGVLRGIIAPVQSYSQRLIERAKWETSVTYQSAKWLIQSRPPWESRFCRGESRVYLNFGYFLIRRGSVAAA
jgi:hypothetical protein